MHVFSVNQCAPNATTYEIIKFLCKETLLKRCLEWRSRPYIRNMTALYAILFQWCKLLDKTLLSILHVNHSLILTLVYSSLCIFIFKRIHLIDSIWSAASPSFNMAQHVSEKWKTFFFFFFFFFLLNGDQNCIPGDLFRSTLKVAKRWLTKKLSLEQCQCNKSQSQAGPLGQIQSSG